MRVAYHFDEDTVDEMEGLWPLQVERVLVLRALIEKIPRHRGHVRLRSGLPGASWDPVFTREQQRELETVLWQPLDCWSSFASDEEFLSALRGTYASVVLVEGIAREDAVAVHDALRDANGYQGAMQVRLDHPVQASFYSLPLSLRLYGQRVGVLITRDDDPEIAGEDHRDHGWVADLKKLTRSLGIEEVDFEYVGLQDTIFDPHRGLDVDSGVGQAERLMETYLSGVVDDVLIRARDRDPGFVTVLAAALKAFEEHEGAEQLAHVSLSCRRALTRLADILYPPRETAKGERSLGPAAYRNRLWAYAEERLQSDSKARVVLATLDDVGARLEALDQAANKGLHDLVDAHEVHRLVLGLVLLVHDFLALAPPSGDPASAYEREILVQMTDFHRQLDEHYKGTE